MSRLAPEAERVDAMDLDVEIEQDSNAQNLEPKDSTNALRPANALLKLIDSDSDAEDSTPETQKPRKSLLGHLNPRLSDSSSDSDEDDNGEGAYERVKQMLMDKSSLAESRQEVSSAQSEMRAAPRSHTPTAASSDEEDDFPVKAMPARRKAGATVSKSSGLHSSPSNARSRHSSPGLFVSPNASPVARKALRMTSPNDSDSDGLSLARHDADLDERIKRIRAERLAKEKRESATKPKKGSRPTRNDDSDSDPDGENGRRLTQQSRPTRKAGKKALEEMSREQQRISRNMQLTHQAKTKKRFTTKDLFARLNFQTGAESTATSNSASLNQPSSDVEQDKSDDTPPTSPPSQEDEGEKELKEHLSGVAAQSESLTDLVSSPPTFDKGKGRAQEFQHLPPNRSTLLDATVRRARIPPSKTTEPTSSNEMIELSDSEDELQTSKPRSRFPVFDRLPQQKQKESSSLLHLRHLAHLTSPGRRAPKGKPSMSIGDLQFSLQQKARQQAYEERQEKIAELERRGIHIETEEERERHQLEIEDLVTKLEHARQEDLKLTKLEKAEAKKNGEIGDGLASSDESEDEDYQASNEEGQASELEEEEAELDLSGSEEESDDQAELDEVEEDGLDSKSKTLIDEVAEEDEDEDEDQDRADNTSWKIDEEMHEDVAEPARARSTHRARHVVIDEEDDSDAEAIFQPSPTQQVPHTSPTQEDNGVAAAFGFDKSSPALGLTQMFAGTMADLESSSQDLHPLDKEPEQDSLDFLRSLPDSQAMFTQAPDMLVPNSQTPVSPRKEFQTVHPVPHVSFGTSQLIETSPAFSHTQDFEPTQDAGFDLSRSPAGANPPISTIETVMAPVAESPVVKRKGKLQRRHQTIVDFSDDEDEEPAIVAEDPSLTKSTNNAFTALKKGAKKDKQKTDRFNKSTSWAKDIVEEQAEESEDEYAGVGGASDDDSGEDDEEVARMIDNEDVKIDERKLAAYYLEKEKLNDEKNINQLYKDIMNGGLRKRRGGDAFDMSDSEDEAEQLRRKKQMKFRQMTKALIADERIGKMAQNPKQNAFFNTLADHLEDPDNDFLNEPEIAIEVDPSQSDEGKDGGQDIEINVPDSQSAAVVSANTLANPLKRKSPDLQEKENRPPPHMRRTAASDSLTRKPMTIADVQHSISEILEDPRFVVPDSQNYESDSDLEIEPPQKSANRQPVIDRSRTTARESGAAASGNMAFVAPSLGGQPGFRVPSLVRRATSNLSAASNGSSGASTPVEGGGVRRGGTGRSNIHAQAREAERRAALEKVEKKRKDELKKKVSRAKNQRSVLASLGGGFE